MFRTFFGVVADVIRDVCGADWTTEMGGAWRQTLADLDYYVTHHDQASTRELA